MRLGREGAARSGAAGTRGTTCAIGRHAARALGCREGPTPPAGDGWAERFARERAVAVRDPAHRPRVIDGAPALGDHARFGDDGAHVSLVGGRGLSLGLAAIGRAGAMRTAGSSAPAIAGPEVRIARGGGVVEWWRSLPSGLEQGVTIAERPAGRGPLRLEMAVVGAQPELIDDDEIALRRDGAIVSRYAHVVALDAGGQRVPARLAVHGARIRIDVDDGSARYPLVVDPLLTVTEEATLAAPAPAAGDFFGRAVALASDGTRAIIGMPNEDSAVSNSGSAYVLVRSGTTWTHEATLLPPSPFSQGIFGSAVAMTADGSRVIVGAPQDDTRGSHAGSAVVFVRAGTVWSLEAALFASDAAADDELGRAVSIDAGGTRAIVGVPKDDPSALGAGSARVFARSGTTWTEEAALVAPSPTSGDALGGAVAISADGARAVVGAEAYDDPVGTDTGSAYVFVRSGATWSLEATLLASDRAATDRLGCAVSLDSTGTRALIGAWGRDIAGVFNVGIARVFVRSGSSWTEEATLLATDGVEGDRFGTSVALSGDGLRALVGAPFVATGRGRAYVFDLVSATWAEAARVDASVGVVGDHFGTAVSLTSDGSRALVGADGANLGALGDVGEARVFSIEAASSDGEPCTSAGECVSGFCSDGLCCAADCGDDAGDCRACSVAAGGAADGSCTPLTAAIAPTVECRAAAGECDLAELCDPASTECPADALAPADFVCRAATACERAETCDGVSVECPALRSAPAGTVCRAAVDLCDAEERCDGASTACPADALRDLGEECRPSLHACDAADFCSGDSADCPDLPAPAGTTCELAGTTGSCPGGVCCTRTCAECEVCGAGGECEPVADGEACSAQCGEAGTCRSGSCVAECPDTGSAPEDAGSRPRAYASGCKCGVTGGRTPPWVLGLFASIGLFRIARRRSARRRRTARS